MPDTPNSFSNNEDGAPKLEPKSERDKFLEAARRFYADDDIAIDDDAALSMADTHVWVSAWVRVPLPLEDP